MDEETMQRVVDQTHVFQRLVPEIPEALAVCAKCGLALPHGPVLAIGPGSLPPCVAPVPMQDNG